MIDFLSSLVDRTLDRMPVLQRRRPSLFEPSTGMVTWKRAPSESSLLESEQEIVFEAEASGRERTGDLSSTTPKLDPESIRPTLPAPNMENAQAVSLRGASPTATMSESEARQREREGAPASLPIERRVKPTAREETAEQASPHRESAAQSFAVAPLRVTETIVEREVETPGFREPSAALPPKRNQTPTVTTPASSPLVKPVIVQAIVPGPNDEKKPGSSPDQKVESQVPIEPRLTVRKELLRPVARQHIPQSRRSQPQVPDAPPIAPTVQVTIGRIEVRATPPASPTRVARPAAPKLSLEDYLRARSEGNK